MPEWHVHLLQRQAARVPFSVLVVDLFIYGYLVSKGISTGMLPWLGLSLATQVGRWWYVRSPSTSRVRGTSAGFMQGLLTWFLLSGLTRVWPLVVTTLYGDMQDRFMMTLVHVGRSAGGVGSVVGVARSYLAGAGPLVLGMVVMWLSQRTWNGLGISLLILLMFGTLLLYVREFGLALARQEALAESLRVERDRAESAAAARGRFVAAASHDLRQPLGVLRWYGDAVALHADKLAHQPLRDIADGIVRAVERAEPMVRKYLDISRFEAGAIEVVPESIDVRRMLREVREAHAHDAESRGLKLLLDLPDDGPSLRVHADTGLLHSAIDNLVGNALKFTPRGSVTLSAQIVARGDQRRVRLAVSDTGIGIAESEHERIFDDFYQVGNPQRSSSEGVGLGLAIARRQAHLLGTEVQLQSVLGQGSVFAIELPCDQSGSEPGETAPLPAPAGLVRRVMIIDDEAEVRASMGAMLRALGWQVATAADSAEALETWEGGRGFVPEVLLVDYRLGGMLTGGDVLLELRSHGLTAPAVFVTADTAPERLRDLAAFGIPVLHKPVALPLLLQEVERVVARHGG
jgi:signal transduction histidine kinase